MRLSNFRKIRSPFLEEEPLEATANKNTDGFPNFHGWSIDTFVLSMNNPYSNRLCTIFVLWYLGHCLDCLWDVWDMFRRYDLEVRGFFFGYRWESSGWLGEAPRVIKSLSCMIFEHSFKHFLSRSRLHPGVIWDHFEIFFNISDPPWCDMGGGEGGGGFRSSHRGDVQPLLKMVYRFVVQFGLPEARAGARYVGSQWGARDSMRIRKGTLNPLGHWVNSQVVLMI